MCPDCNRTCQNQECYNIHKMTTQYKAGEKKEEDKPSTCQRFYECIDCNKLLDSKQDQERSTDVTSGFATNAKNTLKGSISAT